MFRQKKKKKNEKVPSRKRNIQGAYNKVHAKASLLLHSPYFVR